MKRKNERKDFDDISLKSDDFSQNIKQRKKRFSFKRFFVVVLVLFLILIISFFAIGYVRSLQMPDKTYVLLMATDESGTRTDTLMLFCFNENNKSINLLSVPRDTLVEVDDSAFEKMSADFPVPDSKHMKINAVNHFGGNQYGVELLCDEIGKIFDISIDFYAKINFKSFRYIIDKLGGVEFYVPQDMEYHDEYQDLHISLKEGNQLLNGDQAEQLVRYRSGYANGDLGRIDVQHDFMKALFVKFLSAKTIISHPSVYFTLLTGDEYIETNLGFSDCLAFYFILNGLNSDSILSNTLPGNAGTYEGQSVYFIDEEACVKMTESF